MTPEEFAGLFTRSAWRLETLPQYLGGPDDPFHHFERTGELLPLDQRPAKQRWMRMVRDVVASGRTIGRVHTLSRPLTPYLRYELATYPENAAAGEDVRIADADAHPELAGAGDLDFWLLDDAVVLLIDYDPAGRPLGITRTTDPATLASCRRAREVALAWSVPFAEFHAAA
jgi:Family of unknown function (DUF6879)